MKFAFTLLGILLALTLSACSQNVKKTSEAGPDIDTEVEAVITGADRDAHGCIGSAGYEWSELSQECIRIWEAGTALDDVRDPEATSSAYLISGCEGEKFELFLPTGETVMLGKVSSGMWVSETGTYTVKLNASGGNSVFDMAGKLLFQSEGTYETPETADVSDIVMREFGKVVSLEDGAYPMYSVNIEFPKRGMQISRGMKMSFSLNVEAADVDQSALGDMVGKFVSVEYTNELETDLADMLLDGVSLVGNEDGVQEHWVEITGVLDGANAPTMSDLPGYVYLDVTAHDRMTFEYYITDEMVAANGKEVTVYYVSQARHKITKLAISED